MVIRNERSVLVLDQCIAMSAIHLAWNPVGQQLESRRVLVEELRRDVGELRAENAELRRENAELRQQVNSLKCDVGY